MRSDYPTVLSELETLQAVVSGHSLARYGDGEFKLCVGQSAKSQQRDSGLRRRLCGILQSTPAACLVGIPNIHSETPKAKFWRTFLSYAGLLADRPYVSAFVTRPDSAPWIDTPEYWALLESLWIGRDVTLVRGSGKSLTADDLVGAGQVTEIICPRQHAWSSYGELMKRIGTPDRALLCCGATATVLAVDLCARGVHAIDAGHCGMFLRKQRRGDPMWVTDVDRQQEAS